MATRPRNDSFSLIVASQNLVGASSPLAIRTNGAFYDERISVLDHMRNARLSASVMRINKACPYTKQESRMKKISLERTKLVPLHFLVIIKKS